MTSFVILLSLLIDHLLAEPKKFHPLIGFGNLASRLENKFNLIPANHTVTNDNPLLEYYLSSRLSGLFACLLLTITPTILLIIFIHYTGKDNYYPLIIEIIVLYLVIGSRSLEQHALQVKTSLMNGDIQTARKKAGYIVSRETGRLDETAISKATIESVLENGSDAVFAPVFWYCVAGAPGALFYRLINTLDAMWGYRNARYRDFGWAAARLDDLLNWIPARLTALTYSLTGKFKQGLHCWHTQAAAWESPNAGPVMASGAGALNLQLGGPAIYHNEEKMRPVLGQGQMPKATDIERAIKLVKKTLLLWIVLAIYIDILR